MASVLPILEPSRQARRHPHWALVERVASSRCFRSSARLREFLIYVCDCALRDAPDEATEQQIGMHIFHRRAGYNSSEDSIVRTHARGLRQKLETYFREEGEHEEVVIEIPKGHYLPVFQPRRPAASAAHRLEGAAELTRPGDPLSEVDPHLPPSSGPAAQTAVTQVVPAQVGPWNRRRFRLGLLVVLVLFLAAVAVGVWRFAPRLTTRSAARSAAPMSPVQRFWAPFLADDSSMVIYSDALFIGNSTTGLRYAPPSYRDQSISSGDFVDTYTGVGELASVYALTRLFDRYHTAFVLKRSLLVTWDEASQSNLIFIGSVAENPSLRLLPSTMNFTMVTGKGSAGFVNHDPAPGEAQLYIRPEARPGHPMTTDYALLALLPGPQQGKRVLVFSGLTTLGTESAVEFACRNGTVEQLLRRAGRPDGTLRPFEALLQTSIVGGVPIETHLVALHLR
jgi:hypothetical protein